MKVIIDRFEGEYAVVELSIGKFVNMPKELVPNAHEGDVINISIDFEETKKRKKNITKLMNDLFEDWFCGKINIRGKAYGKIFKIDFKKRTIY